MTKRVLVCVPDEVYEILCKERKKSRALLDAYMQVKGIVIKRIVTCSGGGALPEGGVHE